MERKRLMPWALWTELVLLLLLLTTVGLHAQVDTGTILGTVKDQTGAVIPGSKVTITNEGTAFSITAAASNDGTYVFTPIRIGSYIVEVEYRGFQKAVHRHVTVDVQQKVVVDFTLVPGQVTQSVEVTAAVPLLQTQDASVGQVVNSRAINDLPLNGRNANFLAQLVAGVTFGQEDARGFNAHGQFTANGTRPAQNNYLLDGIDNNTSSQDFLNGTVYVVTPPVDALQEFKVQTSNYSAEFGRAGGAVLNVTVKSGTNQLHGDVWEFLRNDTLDAADFFENAGGVKKAEFRRNQFGFAGGGPIYVPHVYDGRNKTFFFGDYEGTRIRQGFVFTRSVPTLAERNSGWTDFSDLISGQSGTHTDPLGRTFPLGAVFDPATTRVVNSGTPDPVTGLINNSGGSAFVRDPFYQGSLVGVTDFTGSAAIALLNQVPLGRLDQNAIKLLNLYPAPTSPGLFSNFTQNPPRRDTVDNFDVRVDHNFSERDQFFARVSYFQETNFRPSPLPGIAEGGAFGETGIEASSRSATASYTHSFSPTLISESRVGFNGVRTFRGDPLARDTSNIPSQFGIPDVSPAPLNGGLPTLGIGGISQLGGSTFSGTQEFDSTAQLSENLTKIYGAHTFKGGFTIQHLKFATVQPAWGKGEFDFGGNYTSIPTQADGSTGRVQTLLTPIPSTVPNGIDNVGGPNSVFASNISNTDDGRNYYGTYLQDDWKVTPELTLNLGLRWEYFELAAENFGAQANFIPGLPSAGAEYVFPTGRTLPLSPSFINVMAKDGIKIAYLPNPGLGHPQKTNFSPRVGFAYQVTPRWVVRGGYGLFYGGLENRGFFPNLGANYPFEFDFAFFEPDDAHPIVYPDGQHASLSRGLMDIPLDARLVDAEGLNPRAIQFNYITPYTQSANLTIQHQLSPNTSLELAYVTTLARHLEVFVGINNITQILPPSENPQNFVSFPDLARGFNYAATEGNSYYHSLQLTARRQFSNGLDFLANYTYAKARDDATDLLNGAGDFVGYRAPQIPHFGIQGDYGLSDFDVRNVVHFSGTYDLPMGQGKRFMTTSRGLANAVFGNWNINWILTLQDGQPVSIPCTIGTAAGVGCAALLVPGQNRIGGKHDVNQYFNPNAFADPPVATTIGQSDLSPLGGEKTQVVGPGFHRLDFSLFKEFKTSERTHLEFRAEFFNITNHPNFSLNLADSNFHDTTNFGRLVSTRDNPDDPRQIQFALKFYW